MPTYWKLASTTLGSSSATVDFASISQAYTDLVLIGTARSSDATQYLDVMQIRCNDNAGAIYNTMIAFSQTTLASSATSFNDTRARSPYGIAAAQNSSDKFGSFYIYFPYYSATTMNKMWTHISGFPGSTTDNQFRLDIGGERMASTAAISKISITLLSGASYMANSVFTLYGIKST